MVLRCLQYRHIWRRLPPNSCTTRSFTTSPPTYVQLHNETAKAALSKTRNIGIIAHIDAGKTTTTERMLYYSGYTRRIGDVDEGSTVTDFLPAERARGITIQSAAISFSWPPLGSDPWIPLLNPDYGTVPGQPNAAFTAASANSHTINLIDTPGHADFTFEVLRSLRVLDGAVCILDGVAGVEAQTEKVWSQASTYRIPRLVFVNKLDRDGAAFGRTVREVGAKLGVWPAVCGIPWWTAEGKLKGVGDVIRLRGLRYVEGGDGKDVEAVILNDLESEDVGFAEELRKARVALVELLAEHDDVMVEDYLAADEDQLAIQPTSIISCLRRCIMQDSQRIAPVYPGASFRNVGVQPLLDAVVDLLPSPHEQADPEVSIAPGIKGGLSQFLSGKLTAATAPDRPKSASKAKPSPLLALQDLSASCCALAFKVVADPKRGVLVYLRVYSGTLTRNSTLWNTNLQVSERAQRLLKMYANDAVEVESIAAGQIGVIPGLKFARTGDTLVSFAGANPKTGPSGTISGLQLRPIDVPPPVFFVSVEPNSLAEAKHIGESLNLLLREDPSLHVSVDEESGQTLLSVMGELHLEIARDRLVGDLRAKARLGGIEIGYREAVTGSSGADGVVEGIYEREVAGRWAKGGVGVVVEPLSEGGEIVRNANQEHEQVFELADKNYLIVATPTLQGDGSAVSEETPSLPDSLLPMSALMLAFRNGVSAACARGPSHSYPMHSTLVRLTFDPARHVFPNTTLAALASAARLGVLEALKVSAKSSDTALMEPVMLVTISVDEGNLGAVVHDISSARGGSIVSLDSEETTTSSDGSAVASIDVSRIYAPPDPFAGGGGDLADLGAGGLAGGMKQIVARVPLKEMVGYLKHLRSLTGGRGTFTMVVDRFERMGGQRMKAVLSGMT
ncbi:Ribosome-releasing factor 2, mitochondrial [Friedmanniomyces endolithicus]|nr:Ribosome-releasing factor 2, mitochondrial [Friedmanniomyces endolithicus]